MGKKLLATLLLLALLTCLLAGCAGKTTADTGQPPATPSDTQALADATTEPADSDEEASVFPLAETATFTGWAACNIDMDPNAKLEDTPGHAWMFEHTNVRIVWDNVSESAASEQFNLMLVSGDYPNVIVSAPTSYPGGLQSCIDQEILMDISSYIEGGCAPNYQALRLADDELRKDTMLDSGAIAGFQRVLTTQQSTYIGWTVQEKLANELGFPLDTCVTLEDYHKLAAAFANYGLETPCELVASGLDPAFMSTFGLTGAFFGTGPFRQVDGQVQYSLIQPEYYDYLTTMKQWYDEGLFNREFYGVQGSVALNNDLIASGSVGIFNMLATQGKLINDLSDRGYRAIPAPLLEEGGARKVAQNGGCFGRLDGVFTAVTTSCQDVETLVRYLDYFYAEEAYNHLNFGIEGETYTVDENGNARYTQEFLDSPDGWVKQMRYYCAFSTCSNLYYWESQKVGQPEEVIYAYDIWDKYYEDEYTLPSLSLTGEENENYSYYYGDISTYASEMVVKFIIGTEPLTEESYAAYVQRVKDMGIQNCIDIYQSAYERYQTR